MAQSYCDTRPLAALAICTAPTASPLCLALFSLEHFLGLLFQKDIMNRTAMLPDHEFQTIPGQEVRGNDNVLCPCICAFADGICNGGAG